MKFKSKLRMAYYLSPDQYWSIEYLSIVTNRSASEIVEEAIKYAVKYLNKGVTKPRKLRVPDKKVRLDTHITRDTIIAVSLVKINENLLGWSNTDFCRYGLRHTLASYAERYPELKKILNKYQLS